jgi:soluble lytic murein transglycosylase-like protein
MTVRTVFAVAVAAGVATFAQFGAAQAEGAEFFERMKDAQVDRSIETGSTGKEAKSEAKAETAEAPHARSTQNPALTAVERSSQKKFTALPGVKKVEIGASTDAVAAAKTAGGAKYTTIVSRYASQYGVPASLVHAVIGVESNYRVDARGRAGEVGLMQIKPATARMLGYSGSVKGLYDPDTNLKFGIKYLAMAQDLGNGSTCSTILKYNAGHGAKRMNPISAAYCAKVKRKLGDA